MKAGPTDRFLCSISTCAWYFDTPALPTTAEVNRSFQVGVPQALSERARGIDNVLREHFETHTVVEWMTEVNLRQGQADKAMAEQERLRVEVESLRRPLMMVQADADPDKDDLAQFRTKYEMIVSGKTQHTWVIPAGYDVRTAEWTLGDEHAPYDSGRAYPEADARQLATDPDGSSVLWTREVTGWRKADAE